MLKKIILPVLVSLTFISCNCQKKTQTDAQGNLIMPKTSDKIVNSTYPTEKPEKNIVRLAECQNVFLKEQQMNVTFNKTLDDSRCPMNARCVWAGNASVEIELMTTTSRPKKFKISVGELRDGLVQTINFGGYKVTLENLYPSNSTQMPFNKLKGKYVIDLKVEKSTN